MATESLTLSLQDYLQIVLPHSMKCQVRGLTSREEVEKRFDDSPRMSKMDGPRTKIILRALNAYENNADPEEVEYQLRELFASFRRRGSVFYSIRI